MRGTEKGKRDVIAEMASVTYKRLEAAMEEAGNAIENEAWELVAALIRLLNQESGIPQEKRLEYAKGIKDFSQELFLEKIARPRSEKQYSHCRELAEYFLASKSMVERLEDECKEYASTDEEGEEVKRYTQTMHTEDFKKAVLSGAWIFENMCDMVLHKKSFHMEIRYNAEARSVVIDTFAPKESLQDGNGKEC